MTNNKIPKLTVEEASAKRMLIVDTVHWYFFHMTDEQAYDYALKHGLYSMMNKNKILDKLHQLYEEDYNKTQDI